MTVFQSGYYSKGFTFTQASNGAALNITGWTFHAQFRTSLTDPTVQLDLTTANGGFAVTDGVNGRVELRITKTQAALLPKGKLVFDVFRTDAGAAPNGTDPVFQFSGSLQVGQAVTRP
jgi:hypothetical protein